MLEHNAQNDDHPADDERESKAAQEPKDENESAHEEMSEKSSLKRIFRPPSDYTRVKAMRAIELIILQRINNIESDQP